MIYSTHKKRINIMSKVKELKAQIAALPKGEKDYRCYGLKRQLDAALAGDEKEEVVEEKVEEPKDEEKKAPAKKKEPKKKEPKKKEEEPKDEE